MRPLGLDRFVLVAVRNNGKPWYVCRVCGTDTYSHDDGCPSARRPRGWTQDGLPACHLVTTQQLTARGHHA